MSTKRYLIDEAKNKKYVLNGIKRSTRPPSEIDSKKSIHKQRLFGTTSLPPEVDLREHMTPTEDQSSVSSCTTNALAGAYEYLLKKTTGRHIDVSRLFMYYNARVKGNVDGGPIEDVGCVMTDAIEALSEFGVCLESLWPYDISKVDTRPSEQAFAQAKDHSIKPAASVDIDLNAMKKCLADGFPFVFGLDLFASFNKASESGIVPMPDKNEMSLEIHGSHAMLAVGYNDQSRTFIVRNSWGEDWGDKGYCYMPYDYLTHQTYCFDVWAIHELVNANFGEDSWSPEKNDNPIDNDQSHSSDIDHDSYPVTDPVDGDDGRNQDYIVDYDTPYDNNNQGNDSYLYPDTYQYDQGFFFLCIS
ncbi:unnamed protein product [Rotaria sp. Silwood2]|nr:unnamed protein product [Rotaria sp. Silwood2]CAF4388143.1 unnamed protein product [Rotaria sp. Silwood2]